LFPEIGVVKADSTVYIRPNGDIESTDLIERNGDVYSFTSTVNSPIVIETNNIVLDGCGYTLNGTIDDVGLNLTTSNVTVRNLNIVGCQTGILGAYNNNSISGNTITGCIYGIKIYAEQYKIEGNYIAENELGIMIHGGSNVVSQNNITGNNIGLRIHGYASRLKNFIFENNFANNENGIIAYPEMDDGIYQEIYHNNFVDNVNHYFVDCNMASQGLARDNGTTGNYWSNYNGTDNNRNGIGDTPYVIDVDNTDIYPLIAPVNVAAIPEFPSWTPLLVMTVSVTLIIILYRKKIRIKED
jgi:nitrous oxidase accessory protein NosD